MELWRVLKPGDPPSPPLIRGDKSMIKVPLFKGDLGGSRLDQKRQNTYMKICQCLIISEKVRCSQFTFGSMQLHY